MDSEKNLFIRIHEIHRWYCDNVMSVRITPEVERLWFEWFKKGYTGEDLRAVIRYLRKEINTRSRNKGALTLGCLLGTTPEGIYRFDTDLGLARANLNVDAKFSPLPSIEVSATPRPAPRRLTAAPAPQAAEPVPTREEWDLRVKQLAEFKRTLTTDATETH